MDYMVILDMEYIIRVGLNPVGPMGKILAGWLNHLFRFDGADQQPSRRLGEQAEEAFAIGAGSGEDFLLKQIPLVIIAEFLDHILDGAD